MALYPFISFLGGVPLCIPYGLYSGTSLGGTTWGILEGFPGRVLSMMHYIIANLQGIFLALKIFAKIDITLKP